MKYLEALCCTLEMAGGLDVIFDRHMKNRTGKYIVFRIDVLNEGIHVESISGVILLRPTAVPIIYKQRIGRALSAASSNDAVFGQRFNRKQLTQETIDDLLNKFGMNLYQWLRKQRTSCKKRQLSQEKINRFNAIGMVWEKINGKR